MEATADQILLPPLCWEWYFKPIPELTKPTFPPESTEGLKSRAEQYKQHQYK